FFSSRRRHTRCYRDWSSDVCSSDLLVIASTAVSSCRAPLRGYPTFDQHPLQRGVKRAFLDLKNVLRYPLNGTGDLISMHLAGARQGLQDQQIECSQKNLVSMQNRGSLP